MDDGTEGILWINIWHDDRNLLSSIGKEERRGGGKWRKSTTHVVTAYLPPSNTLFLHEMKISFKPSEMAIRTHFY